VRRRLFASRTQARDAIESGGVEVDGVVAPKPATMIGPDVAIKLSGPTDRFVGRGGLKLQAALDGSPIDPAGKRALDVGASTGGFTDCLLQAAATSVVALDVGYGQLHWRLRSDPRVTVVERTNIRTADIGRLGGPFDIVVADLSFIGLSLVAPNLAAALGPGGDLIVLVKPQFEVGKDQVGKGGIVRDRRLHQAAIEAVVTAFEEVGVGMRGGVPSPVTGTKGNREFLLWGAHGNRTLSDREIDELVS
jgi:23S rRNA (cytidine1920-2'-O)/16S rRNA (cytidine1409-2'-O)-methyltransferase